MSQQRITRFCKSACVFLSVLLISCLPKDNGAELRLSKARKLFQQQEYELSKQEIDSLKILYPKAFPQIRASLALLDTLRRAENIRQIAVCDSLITLQQPLLESLKKQFVYQRDKEYQETGFYQPKETASAEYITATALRSGVGEDGKMYIESVFVGGNQQHNKIKVSTKDGAFAESLPVTDEGLNFRFSNLGKEYEIIRFAGAHDNGVAQFMVTHISKPLTLTLTGQHTFSYSLSQTTKAGIDKSLRLSAMMLGIDSLKTEKEKAEFRNYYLDIKQRNDTIF